MCSLLGHRTVFSLAVLLVLTSSSVFGYFANAQEEDEDVQAQQKDIPDVNAAIGGETVSIRDSNLKVETVANGFEFPTTMAFLGPNDILILEKEKGTVQRIVNGKMLPEPLLDVNVANKSERGMLGIAVTKNGTTNNTYVFVYFTESIQDGNDDCPKDDFCNPGNDPLGNRLYRYELLNDKLVNPVLLLDLPT